MYNEAKDVTTDVSIELQRDEVSEGLRRGVGPKNMREE